MTSDPTPVRDDMPASARTCTVCGHDEDDHEEQDIEVAGDTLRRTLCRACNDWHNAEFAE